MEHEEQYFNKKKIMQCHFGELGQGVGWYSSLASVRSHLAIFSWLNICAAYIV